MSVDSVNNSNNTALYTTSGAVLGAGAGVAAGYLTKPFLKDDAPTDEFIKKMDSNIKSTLSPEERALANAMESEFSSLLNAFEKAKNVDEIKKVYLDKMFANIGDIDFETFKDAQALMVENFKSMGIKTDTYEKVKQAKSYEEMKSVLSKDFDDTYGGKSLDEVKNMIKAEGADINRKAGKATFEAFWDSSEKKFINCEEGVGKAIKKAAQGIQGKYAAIYGAIGAAVLGLTTYLCCGGKKNEQPVQPQHVNKQV